MRRTPLVSGLLRMVSLRFGRFQVKERYYPGWDFKVKVVFVEAGSVFFFFPLRFLTQLL